MATKSNAEGGAKDKDKRGGNKGNTFFTYFETGIDGESGTIADDVETFGHLATGTKNLTGPQHFNTAPDQTNRSSAILTGGTATEIRTISEDFIPSRVGGRDKGHVLGGCACAGKETSWNHHGWCEKNGYPAKSGGGEEHRTSLGSGGPIPIYDARNVPQVYGSAEGVAMDHRTIDGCLSAGTTGWRCYQNTRKQSAMENLLQQRGPVEGAETQQRTEKRSPVQPQD